MSTGPNLQGQHIARLRLWRRVLITMLCLAVAAATFQYRRAQARVRLIVEIQEAGGWFIPGRSLTERLSEWQRASPFTGGGGALCLEGAKFTDQWLKERDYLSGLRFSELTLDDTLITPAAAAKLIDAHRLDRLAISRMAIALVTVRAIARHSSMTCLCLVDVDITDDDLSELPLESLTELRIAGTKITPAGIGHLTRCQRLQSLDLDGRQLDQASASYLRQLPELSTVLAIDGTLSPTLHQQLQQSLPGRTVRRN